MFQHSCVRGRMNLVSFQALFDDAKKFLAREICVCRFWYSVAERQDFYYFKECKKIMDFFNGEVEGCVGIYFFINFPGYS